MKLKIFESNFSKTTTPRASHVDTYQICIPLLNALERRDLCAEGQILTEQEITCLVDVILEESFFKSTCR